jgi:hypothetical protein
VRVVLLVMAELEHLAVQVAHQSFQQLHLLVAVAVVAMLHCRALVVVLVAVVVSQVAA